MITTALERSGARRRLAAVARIAALAAALVLHAVPADAAPQPFRSPSKSIETSTDMVNLPAPGGTVVVARGCDTCDPVVMHLAPGTICRIGGRVVDYAAFRDRARNGIYSMTVQYHRETFDVLQLSMALD